MKTKIEGNHNIVSEGDATIFIAPDEKKEQGIIEELFEFVLEQVDENKKSKNRPNKLVHTLDKIKLNFTNVSEQNEVKQYFTNSYNKITQIEKYFETLDNEEQNDIHNFAHLKYQELKHKYDNPIETLRNLFKEFVPKNKESSPLYVNISNAIVLFFFDDCTIFEKTKKEESKQTSIFDSI
jgi:hypothetical protein